MIEVDLIAAAEKARQHAYAPYSNFKVGAALECSGGEVFTGCNVENVSYGLTICAERSAVVAAVAEGCTRFRSIVIVADSDLPVTPCGACRQVLAEFAPALEVAAFNLQGAVFRSTLTELLPRPAEGILNRGAFHVEQ